MMRRTIRRTIWCTKWRSVRVIKTEAEFPTKASESHRSRFHSRATKAGPQVYNCGYKPKGPWDYIETQISHRTSDKSVWESGKGTTTFVVRMTDNDGWQWMMMMMDDDGWRWWMTRDDDGWWWMKIDDDGWWWTMMGNEVRWCTMMDDDGRWWTMINDDERWTCNMFC